MPQIQGLLDGFSKIKMREADAVKGSSIHKIPGGNAKRGSVGSLNQLKRFPGVRRKKRRK